MAKKKAVINLTSQNIEFDLLQVHYKVLSFNPNKMTFHVHILQNGEMRENKEFPFAHAPKEIKKCIKPN